MNTVNKFIGALAGIGKNMDMNNKRSKRLGCGTAVERTSGKGDNQGDSREYSWVDAY